MIKPLRNEAKNPTPHFHLVWHDCRYWFSHFQVLSISTKNGCVKTDILVESYILFTHIYFQFPNPKNINLRWYKKKVVTDKRPAHTITYFPLNDTAYEVAMEVKWDIFCMPKWMVKMVLRTDLTTRNHSVVLCMHSKQ